jgi:hypothetical protein
MDFVPFDLRHLPIIIYDRDNLKGLIAKLTKRIVENKSYFASQIRLREKYQHQFTGEHDLDDIFDVLNGRDQGLWKLIIYMLGFAEGPMNESDVVYSVLALRAEMSALATAGRYNVFRNLFKIYIDVLVRCLDVAQIQDHALDILQSSRFPEFRIEENEMNSLLIDFSISLYQHPAFKRRALEWLFNYLGKGKVGGIDINRAKVEHFVLHTRDVEVYEFIIYSLDNDNSTLREAAADFLGEMKIAEAVPNLVITLQREVSAYVARSIFSALGKIGSVSGAGPIIDWVTRNVDLIRDRKLDFVIDHASRALSSIDRRNQTSFLASLPAISL